MSISLSRQVWCGRAPTLPESEAEQGRRGYKSVTYEERRLNHRGVSFIPPASRGRGGTSLANERNDRSLGAGPAASASIR